MDAKATLIQLMGLPAEADDTLIENTCKTFQSDMVAYKTKMDEDNTKLRNSASEAVARAEGAQKLIDAANTEKTTALNEVKTLREELVNHDMEAFKDVIVNKEDVKEGLMTNRAGTIKILKGLKKEQPLYNRNRAGQPGNVTEVEVVATEAEAKKINNRAREMQKTMGLSYQQAFIAARGEFSKVA